MKSFLLMLTFLTRIPIKYPYEYKKEDLSRGISLLPLIGLIIGMILWGVAILTSRLDNMVTSLLVWSIYIWITGGLHIDGLADTVDGVFSNRDQERMLEIMKDSRIGTFGVISILMMLAFNIVLTNYIDYKLLVLVPVIGRSCALLISSVSKYARDEGMGKEFIESCGRKERIMSYIYPIIIGSIIDYKLIIPIVITMIVALYLVKHINNKIGGITGDVIGFTIEITQTIFIFVAYILNGVLI